MPDVNAQYLADLFGGLTPRRIQQLTLKGAVVKVGKNKYDLLPSVTKYIHFLKVENSEQTKLTSTNRKIKELALKKKEGELVNAEDMKRVIKSAFNTVKQGIRSIPPKCSQRLAALKVGKKKQRALIAEVEELLSQECDQALEALSKHRD